MFVCFHGCSMLWLRANLFNIWQPGELQEKVNHNTHTQQQTQAFWPRKELSKLLSTVVRGSLHLTAYHGLLRSTTVHLPHIAPLIGVSPSLAFQAFLTFGHNQAHLNMRECGLVEEMATEIAQLKHNKKCQRWKKMAIKLFSLRYRFLLQAYVLNTGPPFIKW